MSDVWPLYSEKVMEHFKTFGCGAAIATSSTVTELVKGKRVGEGLEISTGAVDAIKMRCSVLAKKALKSAIEDYLNKSKGG